jgi:glycosyltransferase involved in cell wall biosynthesis
MKICYLADASSIHTRKWAKYFVEKNNEVHVISFESGQIEGATVHIIKLPILVRNATFPLKVLSVYRIRSLISKLKPHVLHAHYVTNYGFFATMCNFKPFVLTAWGSDILAVPEQRIISMVKKLLAQYVLRRTDQVTCDARHMSDALKKLGVPSEKIAIIHFGIDTRRFSPDQKSRKIRARLRLGDWPAVISLRNLEPLYDIESLVKAAPLVLKEVPQTKFVIAGKGSEEKRLKDLSKTLDVSESVKFIGFIQNEELPQYLNSMDVYVSTSLSDAGIAASTAEAMACGLPVIVTDVADNRAWVDDGVSGFVVPKKDPPSLAERIVTLLSDEELRRQFGKFSRKIIEDRNDYYKEMGKMETIYQNLIRRYGR